MNKFTKIKLPRNPHATLTPMAHKMKYESSTACPDDSIRAYGSDGNDIPLYMTLNFRQPVEFIVGHWRIQDILEQDEWDFIDARGEQFIVHQKLPDTTNNFTYYSATKLPLIYNCYGPLSVAPDYVLANLHTHWGYGRNKEQASAFLSRRLADVYRPAIDAAIALEKQNTL